MRQATINKRVALDIAIVITNDFDVCDSNKIEGKAKIKRKEIIKINNQTQSANDSLCAIGMHFF